MELRLELNMKQNNTKLKQLMAKKKPIVWPGSVSPISRISQLVQDIESGNYRLLDPTHTLHDIKKLEMVQGK